jgi:hypothetical protein
LNPYQAFRILSVMWCAEADITAGRSIAHGSRPQICSTPENSPINPLSRGMQGNEEQTRKGKIVLAEAIDS